MAGDATITTARALIELLEMRGVDHLLGNPGSEFVPLIEAYAELREGGHATPKPLTVAHESVAVHMAYGAYLASGRPQAVMVHTTVGTANASLALMNAARMNIPLLFIAGRTPVSERGRAGSRDKFIHWAQEMYDQGAMVREWVKWDYELRDAAMLPEVLDRALAIAMSPPRGPVYLMLPRELLYEPVTATLPRARAVRAETPAAPDPAALAELRAALATSQRPLLLTKTAGTSPETVALLERAAQAQQLPVICEDAHCVNIAADHPCFGGFSHAGLLGEADLLLCLDVDVPWIPAHEQPHADARVIHVGEQPLFDRLPVRSHRGELMLRCDVSAFLQALGKASAKPADGAARAAWLQRVRERAEGAAAAQRREATRALEADEPPCAANVGVALGALWDERCTLINELHLPPASLPVMAPASYFRTGSASGLGWGIGVGLGIRLADAERTVIAVVGDGALMFGNPLAVLWQSLASELPLLLVVLDNGGMGSIRAQVRRAFPRGAALRRDDFVFCDLSPALDYSAIASAAGAHGEAVSRASELEGALRRGVDAVRGGQPALVHVRLADGRASASDGIHDAPAEAPTTATATTTTTAAQAAAANTAAQAAATAREARFVEARGQRRSIEARELIFEAGAPADGLHFIERGNVKIVQAGPQGKETVVRIAGAGDVVGHRSIFSLSRYRASAVALEPVRTIFVAKADVLELVADEPRFAATLLRKLSDDLSATEQRALFFHQLNVRERVCALLLMLRRSHGVAQDDGSWRLSLRLTRSELASMIAAAMENVVRVLTELRKGALIREDDSFISILDVERLQAMLPAPAPDDAPAS